MQYFLTYLLLFSHCVIFAQKIAAGGLHSIAICSDSTVKSWGQNGSGQLGNGNNTDSNIPVQVSYLSKVIAVSLGNSHSLALKADGTVWAWGSHFSGELGVGSGTVGYSTVPLKITSLSNIVAISAGFGFSMALKNDGTVWVWGYNIYGNLGNGTTTSTNVPIPVSGISNITAISAGYMHCLALQSDSTVWSWGGNASGQLGDGTNNDSYIPIKINNFGSVYAIDAGGFHSLALKQIAQVWSWGGGVNNAPAQVSTITNPLYGTIFIAAGLEHSFALRYSGRLRGWGKGTDGQLGDGTNGIYFTPVQVTSFTTGAVSAAAGDAHSLILKNDGTLWATGSNFYGQLGTGNNTDSNVPIQINGLCTLFAGLEEVNTSAYKVDVFPNPSDGIFTININSQLETFDLQIYNSIGALVHSQKINTVTNKVNKRELTSGLYSCVLLSEGQKVHNFKIAIN